MAKPSIFNLLLFYLLLKLTFGQECERSFLMQPDKLDSTIDCNINGRTVEVGCNIDKMGYQISWHFTTSREGAGQQFSGTILSNKIINNVGGYHISTNIMKDKRILH